MSSRAGVVVSSALASAWFAAKGVKPGRVNCDGLPPTLYTSGTFTVGSGLSLRSRHLRTELGAVGSGRLVIGDRVFINQGCSIVAHLDIRIDDDARIGDLVGIYDSNHHRLEEDAEIESAPVHLERNVWIGRGAVILPGVVIGAHSVVGAGSVITKSIETRTLVAGNPARPIRSLNAAELWRRS